MLKAVDAAPTALDRLDAEPAVLEVVRVLSFPAKDQAVDDRHGVGAAGDEGDVVELATQDGADKVRQNLLVLTGLSPLRFVGGNSVAHQLALLRGLGMAVNHR